MGMAEAGCWGVRDGASDQDWLSAHTALKRIARERAAADAEEGRCLLAALRAEVHEHLGYGSFAEYVERLLGYSSRATREKLRVAEALEGLPLSARALEQGKLSWCAVRELTRVATAETELAWLERAHGRTTRELEQLVAGKRPGDLPPRAGEAPPPRRHVLRFEVSPETFATFKQATQSLRRAAGGGLDDDALLLTMARQVLGTPTNVGRSSYRISYELCPACRHGGQVVGGELIAVSQEVLDMAACDAEHVALSAAPANENWSLAGASDAGARETAPALAHVGREPSDDASRAIAADTLERPATLQKPAILESPATTQTPIAVVASSDPCARQLVPPAVRHATAEAVQATADATHMERNPFDELSAAANTIGSPAAVESPVTTSATGGAPHVQNPVSPAVHNAFVQGFQANADATHVSRNPSDEPCAAANTIGSPAAVESPATTRTTHGAPHVQNPVPSAVHRTLVEPVEPTPDVAHVGREPSDNRSAAADLIESSAAVPKPRAPSIASAVPRARQAVPPAVRRAVLVRDRQRCQVPGCTHTQFVDVHHVRPRADGGRNTIDNLITLCTAHHRAVHRGELVVEGSAAEPRFLHADGTPYGEPVDAQPIDAHTKVFAALRHLGFREREVNAVLAELRNEAALRDAPVNVLLREALCRIRTGQ